jgi:sugar phosphate isomerase/epimerase
MAMKTMKGPALFIAQFAGDKAPFNSLDSIAKWAAGLGYKGLQIHSWDPRFIDLKKAAESKTYADEVNGTMKKHGLEITELSTHLQGQLVSVHPAYDVMFDGFAAPEVRGNPKKRQEWAVQQMMYAAQASKNLGLKAHVTFSGALAWPYVYPWPQRPDGLIEEAFKEQGRRWKPILDAFDKADVDLCYEIHPGEDMFDGDSFEQFREAVGNHPRCCINYDASHFIKQAMDYVAFIDHYHPFIKAFHVKDAEFNPTGKQGVFSGYRPWLQRAARDRSLGDGGVNYRKVFSKMTQYGYSSWAVYEWECCIMHPEEAARKGAPYIADHIIQVTDKTFDDFAATGADLNAVRKILGVG